MFNQVIYNSCANHKNAWLTNYKYRIFIVVNITYLKNSAHAILRSIPFQELKQAWKDLDKCFLPPIESVPYKISDNIVLYYHVNLDGYWTQNIIMHNRLKKQTYLTNPLQCKWWAINKTCKCWNPEKHFKVNWERFSSAINNMAYAPLKEIIIQEICCRPMIKKEQSLSWVYKNCFSKPLFIS